MYVQCTYKVNVKTSYFLDLHELISLFLILSSLKYNCFYITLKGNMLFVKTKAFTGRKIVNWK